MANYRQIHVSIWKDDWFLDLDTEAKLLFIYLFSNELASLAGIYKLPLKVIAFETGLSSDYIMNTLAMFEQAGKVYYQNGIVWIRKMRDYNRGGDKVQIRINTDLDQIPDCELKRKYLAYHTPEIPYPYPIHTLSYEEEEEMKKNEDPMKGSEGGVHPPLSNGDAFATNIYTQVTGHMIIPGDTQKKIEAEHTIRTIAARQAQPVAYLQPFWQEWNRRKYNQSNTGWLTDWAVTGVIPASNRRTNAKQRTAEEALSQALAAGKEFLNDGE